MILDVDGKRVELNLPPGNSLRTIGDDYYIARGNLMTRVALHVDERKRVVDSIIPLDTPVPLA